MNLSRKMNVTAHGVNRNAKILRSDQDFERWYRKQYDFSMFTEVEIKQAMEEVRPEYYPCLPLLQEGGYDVTYLGEDLVKYWFSKLYTVTLSPL